MFRFRSSLAHLLAVCAPVLATKSQPPAAPSVEPAALGREFDAIRAAVDSGRPALASDLLAKLLGDEARRAWALGHREALVEEARRIAFALSYVPPAPRELVSGQLGEWVPRSGVIRIAYGPDNDADFAPLEDGVRVHPVVFAGDYGVTVRGTTYPNAGPGVRMLVAATPESSYCVAFGRAATSGVAAPLQILRLTPTGTECVAELAASPLRAASAFRVGVRVTATSVQVSVEGKVVLRADERRPASGQIGLWPCEFTALQIEGTVTTAWIDSLRDQHRHAAMQSFASTFDSAQRLPPWLVAAPVLAFTLPAYPCAVAAQHADELAACVHLLEQQRFDECLARAATTAAESSLPPRVLMWLRALAFAGKREFAHALLCVEELLRRAPDFARAQELEARLLWGNGQRAAAIDKARALVAKAPDYVDAVTALISFELCSGRRHAAVDLQTAARARGLHSDEFDRVAHTLTKAERGPDWSRRFAYPARHCEVASDIDQRTCVDVASTLQEAFATFTSELGALDRQVQPVRVFVFAGESSYRAYLADVIGTVPMHTTGIYSHALGQLLLWQTPDRGRMLQTVRHEGLHWYLEHLLREPPRWLNEGLAQYYEAASARGARAGAVSQRALWVASLRQKQLVPLAEFVACTDREFYADPVLSYAQSWAVVTMLREGSQPQRALLTSLLAALARGEPTGQAIAAVLPPVQLTALDRELRAWLDAQR